MSTVFSNILNLFLSNETLSICMTNIGGFIAILSPLVVAVRNFLINSENTEKLMSLDREIIEYSQTVNDSIYRDTLLENHERLQKKIHRKFARSYYFKHRHNARPFTDPLSRYVLVFTVGVSLIKFFLFLSQKSNNNSGEEICRYFIFPVILFWAGSFVFLMIVQTVIDCLQFRLLYSTHPLSDDINYMPIPWTIDYGWLSAWAPGFAVAGVVYVFIAKLFTFIVKQFTFIVKLFAISNQQSIDISNSLTLTGVVIIEISVFVLLLTLVLTPLKWKKLNGVS